MSQFVPVASVTVHHWNESGSILFSSLQTFVHIDEISPARFFSRLNSTSSLSLSLLDKCFGSFAGLSSVSVFLLFWGDQNWIYQC